MEPNLRTFAVPVTARLVPKLESQPHPLAQQTFPFSWARAVLDPTLWQMIMVLRLATFIGSDMRPVLADLASLARNTLITAITPNLPLTVLTRPTPGAAEGV